MMTKKHFIAIAEIMTDAAYGLDRDTADVFPTSGKEMHADIVGRLSDYFADDNPNFDRDRFLKACGV